MRRTDGRLVHRSAPPPLPGSGTPRVAVPGASAVPSPATPAELCARAAGVLDQLCDVEREQLEGQALRIDRIDAITDALGDLQSAIAEAPSRALGVDDLVVLRRARRFIANASLLTLDLLARSPVS